MTPHKLIETTLRVYAVLLHLYPGDFRRAYGALMAQLLRDQCHDAVARRGRLSLLAVWLRTLLDLVVTAFQEHLHAAASVGLINEPVMPLPWRQVLLAILPGILRVVERASLQPWSASSFLAAWRQRLDFDSWIWASVILVAWSLYRHRRLAVWAYPAAGLLLVYGPPLVGQALFPLQRAQVAPPSLWQTLVVSVLSLIPVVAGLIVLWKHRRHLRASTFTWITLAALAVSSAWAFHLAPLIMLGLVLPAATGLMGVRRDRISAALWALGTLWWWVDGILDPIYGLLLLTDAYVPVLLITLLLPFSMLILPVVGVLRARTTYRQFVCFTALPFLGFLLAEVGRWVLLGGTQRPASFQDVAIGLLGSLQIAAVLGLVALTFAQYDHRRPLVTER